MFGEGFLFLVIKTDLHFLFRAKEVSHTESHLLINPDGTQITHLDGKPDPEISLFSGQIPASLR